MSRILSIMPGIPVTGSESVVRAVVQLAGTISPIAVYDMEGTLEFSEVQSISIGNYLYELLMPNLTDGYYKFVTADGANTCVVLFTVKDSLVIVGQSTVLSGEGLKLAKPTWEGGAPFALDIIGSSAYPGSPLFISGGPLFEFKTNGYANPVFTFGTDSPPAFMGNSLMESHSIQAGEVTLYPGATGYAEAEFDFPTDFSIEPYMVANVISMDGSYGEVHKWRVIPIALSGNRFKIIVKNAVDINGTFVKVQWMARA